MTEPIDSTVYTKTVSKITISKDGLFNEQILKVDSNIVELKKQ